MNYDDSLINFISSNELLKQFFDEKLLQENIDLKKELETLKIKHATSEIRNVFNGNWGLYGMAEVYIKADSKETFIEYIVSRCGSNIVMCYINLCKQHGFDLVDKVIEDMVDEKRKEMESEE